MPEYVWMCLYKRDSEYSSCPKYAKILNMAKFWIWQGFQYASITQRSEYARICLDRVLNNILSSKYDRTLNRAGFWIWQGSEYVNVPQGSKYATILLNMS